MLSYGGARQNLCIVAPTVTAPDSLSWRARGARFSSPHVSGFCHSLHLSLYVLRHRHDGIFRRNEGAKGEEFLTGRGVAVV
jgi:hypothetical protein